MLSIQATSRTLAAAILGAALINPGITRAASLTPILHLSALGGQYFTGATHATGANLDGSFVPVIGLNSRLYLIPIYLGSYHETQSVYNFLGQNTLIQKQLDQTIVLRSAWAANSNWKIKPRAGYTREWIKQTSDESLSSGLFNFYRISGGISAERALGRGSLELSYDHNVIKYPNYQALIADPRLTSTGITQNAGTDVLNFNSNETSLLYQTASRDKRWNLNANFTWVREDFADQKVITTNDSGFEGFADKRRTDDIFNIILLEGFRKNNIWQFNIGETVQYYTSNQNSFDATQLFSTPFTYRYYNFMDYQLNPSVTLSLDEGRWDTTLAGNAGYRRYSHRRSQDGLGNYQNDLVYSLNRGATLTFRFRIAKNPSAHPRWKGLYAVLTGNVLTYSSNTRFEVNYPYNYTVSNYLAGLSWDL